LTWAKNWHKKLLHLILHIVCFCAPTNTYLFTKPFYCSTCCTRWRTSDLGRSPSPPRSPLSSPRFRRPDGWDCSFGLAAFWKHSSKDFKSKTLIFFSVWFVRLSTTYPLNWEFVTEVFIPRWTVVENPGKRGTLGFWGILSVLKLFTNQASHVLLVFT